MKKKKPINAKPGKARQFLTENFGFIQEGGPLSVGHVLFLFTENERSVAKTIRSVTEKLGVPCEILPHRMKAVTDILNYYKNIQREHDMENFVKVCGEPFTSYTITAVTEPELADVSTQALEPRPSEPVPSTSASDPTSMDPALSTPDHLLSESVTTSSVRRASREPATQENNSGIKTKN